MSRAAQPSRDRDTRLLVTTLLISAGMLLLLARFRFPDKPAPPEPAAAPARQPLERLAARATYEELAGILAGLEREVRPSIVPLAIDRDRPDPRAGGDTSTVPAIRVGTERAVALIGGPAAASTFAASADVHGVLAVDAPRGLALVNVPAGEAPPWREPTDVPAPGYAASVVTMPDGPAVRPFYFGRVDRIVDPRWPQPLLLFSGLQQVPPAGAAIFLLDGRFVGLGTPRGDAFVVIPPAALRQAVGRLETSGSVALADLGVEIAPLTTEVAAALGSDTGVVVTHVSATGPSHDSVRAGDVIRRIDGRDIASAEAYDAAIAQLAVGHETTIELRRRGAAVTATVVPEPAGRPASDAPRELGLDLQPVARLGAEVVRVAPESAGAAAGILLGDVITLLGDAASPSPAQVKRAFDRATAGTAIVVGVQRGTRHLILALRKP